MQPDQHSLPLQSHPLPQHPPHPMLNSLQQQQQQQQTQHPLPHQLAQQQPHPHQQQQRLQQNIRSPLNGATLNPTAAYTSLPMHHTQPTLALGLDRTGGMTAVNSSQGLILTHQQQQQLQSSQQSFPAMAPQQHQQLAHQQQYEDDVNAGRYYMGGKLQQQPQPQQSAQQQSLAFSSPGSNKRKASYQHPSRPNPTMYPSPASSTTTPVLQSASLGPPMPLASLVHPSASSTTTAPSPSVMAAAGVSNLPSTAPYATSSARTQAPMAQMSQMPHLPPGAAPRLLNASGSTLSTAFLPGNPDPADVNYIGSTQAGGVDLYAHQQDAPLFPSADVHGWSAYSNIGASQPGGVSEVSSSGGGSYRNSRVPSFDVKAYTFRKKPRHYVAVKPKNALRIEPIIYLRTSILDAQRNPVKSWDFLRFSTNRFRENALPKKKLNNEEMKGAKILDVDIVLVSPNNGFRQIEESCPACVMRMDGERKIMQVLAKNFKMTPAGEPVIDIRKGHAIVCIKLNCYCDHHNESEGFVVRLQTHPETVRMGGSVKLRICCEARSKNGPQEQEQEEEDGLTDIDAPGSIGSRSPAPTNDHLQSPSLSYGSPSPMVKGHGRTPSSTASSVASPRSFDDRSVTGSGDHISDASGYPPPKFRNIYPLTPSEGTCLGGTRVTIHGSNFSYLHAPVVFFGDMPAELVMVSHDDVMECTTPPAQGLKPGLVQVKIASPAFPEGQETETADFLYMAPLDYDFCNLAAASLSFAMSGEYYENNVNNLAALFGTQGAGLGDSLVLGLDGGGSLVSGGGFTCAAMESMALDFLSVIKQLAPNRPLRAHRTEAGHTWLHLAVYRGMASLAKELIKMGLDYTTTADNGRTALDLARTLSSPHQDIVAVLENAETLRREGTATTTAAQPSDAAPGASAESASTQGLSFNDLIERYKPYLLHVCEEERQRKAKAEDMRAKRSRDLMAFRVKEHMLQQQLQRQAEEDTRDEEDDVMTEEEVNDDGDGGDSMDGISYGSASKSPSPLLSVETKLSRSGSPSSRNKSPTSPWSPSRRMSPLAPSADVISASRMNHIKSDIQLWESTRRHGIEQSRLDHIIESLGISSVIQTWVCQDLAASDGSESPSLAPKPSCIVALSATGIHVYPRAADRHGSRGTDQSSRAQVMNWSIVEIEDLTVSMLPKSSTEDPEQQQQQQEEEQQSTGEVTIRFGELRSPGEQVQFSSKNASELANMIAKRHQTVMRYLHLRPRIESKTTSMSSPLYQPQPAIEKDEEWLKATLKMWCGICNVERVSWDHIEWKDNARFRLLPLDDGAPMLNNSANFMVALLRTLSDLESCVAVDLSGSQLESDGWEQDATLHELENMARRMRQVKTWNMSGCRWRSRTAKVFFKALAASPAVDTPQSSLEQHHSYKVDPASLCVQSEQQCINLYLADNLIGDGAQENMGQFLTGISATLPWLNTLDLTNCSLNLEAMEYLTHHLPNIQNVRLAQNQADERWWQWMNVLIERNPSLETVSIGAPVKPSDEDQSLLSFERLESLQYLKVLDLSDSSLINTATLAVIERLVEHRAKQVQEDLKKREEQQGDDSLMDDEDRRLLTISLGHCNLAWKQVSRLFQTICKTNTWSKFTLSLDKNPLFDDADSVEQWKQDVLNSNVDVAFGIRMTDLVLPNATVRELLEPLEHANCLNELNLSGLCIIRENERADLQGRSYDECWQKVRPTDASLETCEMLRRVVENNKTLIQLDLSGAQMPRPQHGRRGGFGRRITAMFPALSRNTTLRILTMNRNGFGEDGLGQLAEALRFNRRLNVLDTAGNDAYTYQGLSQMEKILPPPQFQGGLIEAQQAGYNSTLAVWKTQKDEVMMHLDLMGREIQRLQTDLLQAEKAHKTAAHGTALKANTAAALWEAQERVNRAREDRTRYDQTFQNITQSILANSQRVDDYYDALEAHQS